MDSVRIDGIDCFFEILTKQIWGELEKVYEYIHCLHKYSGVVQSDYIHISRFIFV